MTSPRLGHGIPSIAEYLNCTPRKLYRVLDRKAAKDARLPLWKFGHQWCATSAISTIGLICNAGRPARSCPSKEKPRRVGARRGERP